MHIQKKIFEKAKQFHLAHVEKLKQTESGDKKDSFFSYADTLEFWKTYKKDLPYLSKQAKIYSRSQRPVQA